MHKPRFSLLSLLIVVTAVACICGIQLYIYERFYWGNLYPLLLSLAAVGLGHWLTTSAPWSARIFAIGFVLGAFLEIGAGVYYSKHEPVDFAPGVRTPEGFYPLSIPIYRWLVTSGLRDWQSVHSNHIAAIFTAMLVSGAILGSAFCTTWYLLVRPWMMKAKEMTRD